MSKNSASTKWLQIGAAVRVERQARQITLADFAQLAGFSKGHMSKIENGQVPLKEHLVAKMLTLLRVKGARYDEIIKLLDNADAAEWTATEVGDRDAMNKALIDFEARAGEIVDSALAIVPGLIQVPEYTRAIMSSGFVPSAEIAARVAMRMGRSSVIDPQRSDTPAKYTALLDEAVLRKRVGSATVMVKQLRFLMNVASWSNATIRVIPDSAGWYPGMTGAFSKINPRDPDDLAVVYLETRRSGQILHLDEDMEEYDRTIVAAQRAAMSPDDTAKLIAAAIEWMEQTG